MPKAYRPPQQYKPSVFLDSNLQKNNFAYGLMLFGKRISSSNTATTDNTYTVIHTVPIGKTFFLLGAELTLRFHPSIDVGEREADIRFNAAGISSALMRFSVIQTAQVAPLLVDSINPSIPLRMDAGETIGVTIDSATNARANGQVWGYEIDTALIPNLI